jgi:hypothetical protein
LKNIGENICHTLLLYEEEKEKYLGFDEITYEIQQFHLDKEAKLEQEELIKQ